MVQSVRYKTIPEEGLQGVIADIVRAWDKSVEFVRIDALMEQGSQRDDMSETEDQPIMSNISKFKKLVEDEEEESDDDEDDKKSFGFGEEDDDEGERIQVSDVSEHTREIQETELPPLPIQRPTPIPSSLEQNKELGQNTMSQLTSMIGNVLDTSSQTVIMPE